MAQACTVCQHQDRDAINQALIDGQVVRTLATRYGLVATSLNRHKANHLPSALVAAQDAAEVAQADDLLSRLQRLLERAEKRQDYADGLFARAVQAEDFRAGASALQAGSSATREVRACIELLLEVEGEISRRPEVNITISAEWVEIRTVILAALQTHPEARQDVVRALGKVASHAVA